MNKPNQDKAAIKKYSYEGKKVYIGLDVHKQSYSLTAKCEGMMVKQDRLTASPEALYKYLDKRFSGAEIFSAYEAGFCGFHLHRFLCSSGIKNIVVHPASIEISSRDRVKTDKRDSLKIATQLEVGRLRGVNVPSIEQEQRREITRLREVLLADRHQTGCRIVSFFDRHQELEWTKTGVMSRKLLASLVELDLPSEYKIVVKTLSLQWAYIDNEIKKLDDILKQQAKEDAEIHNIIQTTPGIGLLGARIISNEIGDMKQFTNVKHLYSFTGLTPSEYSSGENRRQGHITRQGRSILRKILVQAAWTAIRRDPDLGRKYEEIAKRAGAKKAIVAIARILIGRVRACVRKNEEYLVAV